MQRQTVNEIHQFQMSVQIIIMPYIMTTSYGRTMYVVHTRRKIPYIEFEKKKMQTACVYRASHMLGTFVELDLHVDRHF